MRSGSCGGRRRLRQAPQAKSDPERIVTILDESFEDESLQGVRGFPTRAGTWSGDMSSSIAAEEGVAPKTGERMVRLPPHATRKFSYAQRIVDLSEYPLQPGDKVRRIEVEASFHDAGGGVASRHQIRLAAFAEEPAEVKAIWSKGADLFDSVLVHVGRTVTAKSGTEGWHTVRSMMEVPPGARSLVISIAAASVDDAGPKPTRYLDDVHARFVIRGATP